jgi:hypothetical protein
MVLLALPSHEFLATTKVDLRGRQRAGDEDDGDERLGEDDPGAGAPSEGREGMSEDKGG